MFKRRLIPVLFLKDGWMVRSQTFSIHQVIGDPVGHVRRMVQWDVDELIVLDIGAHESTFTHLRSDYRNKPVHTVAEFINLIAAECSIPLTFGGRIRSIEDIQLRIQNGADKVVLNSMLFDSPDLVTEAAYRFGSQAIVASIDYRTENGRPMVFTRWGKDAVGVDAAAWARRAVDLGVGEIFLNSIERDGTARGYDFDATNCVAAAVRAPIITCGGAGVQNHFLKCFQNTAASAIAAGNIFHFTENAYPNAKVFLRHTLNDIR